jgi:hypothetical protein
MHCSKIAGTTYMMKCALHTLGVFKKINQPIKPKKLEKYNRKNRTDRKNQVNRLKNKKNHPVRFGSGLKKLKPIEPDQTEPV